MPPSRLGVGRGALRFPHRGLARFKTVRQLIGEDEATGSAQTRPLMPSALSKICFHRARTFVSGLLVFED
jgi:hypothetical protein